MGTTSRIALVPELIIGRVRMMGTKIGHGSHRDLGHRP